MRRLNPDWVRSIKSVMNGCPYWSHASMMLVDLSLGRSRVEIDLEAKHLTPNGTAHGGVFSGLIDTAGYWAVYPELDDETGLLTAEMKLNYLAPASDGKLIGLGRRLKICRTLALSESRVEDKEGRLLAHGMVTTMVIPGMSIRRKESMPPKFLGRGS